MIAYYQDYQYYQEGYMYNCPNDIHTIIEYYCPNDIIVSSG